MKNALVKDGWTITDDPLRLKYKAVNLSVDLGAERTLAAEREGEKIAVENPRCVDTGRGVTDYYVTSSVQTLVNPLDNGST